MTMTTHSHKQWTDKGVHVKKSPSLSATPSEPWLMIWSTNPLERLHKEIKRRTPVVGIFTKNSAITCLLGALLL